MIWCLSSEHHGLLTQGEFALMVNLLAMASTSCSLERLETTWTRGSPSSRWTCRCWLLWGLLTKHHSLFLDPNAFQSPQLLWHQGSISWTVACQALRPTEFSRQEHWSGHSLLQRIFLTQGSNLHPSDHRQTLYHLNHQGSPFSYLDEILKIIYINYILWHLSSHLDKALSSSVQVATKQ